MKRRPGSPSSRVRGKAVAWAALVAGTCCCRGWQMGRREAEALCFHEVSWVQVQQWHHGGDRAGAPGACACPCLGLGSWGSSGYLWTATQPSFLPLPSLCTCVMDPLSPPALPRLSCVLLSTLWAHSHLLPDALHCLLSSPIAPNNNCAWAPPWITSHPAFCSAAPFSHFCSLLLPLSPHRSLLSRPQQPLSCEIHGHFSVCFLCCPPLNLPAPIGADAADHSLDAFLARPPTCRPGLLLSCLAVPSPGTLGPSLDPFSLCCLSRQP